ncbi:MAG: type II toxin-antitoxin system VapC family toxin [Thaumarchaeota archaeon]|nr:type II toxin-antitoxin system VapC family toxin [Nitrososphaerota archaeon]
MPRYVVDASIVAKWILPGEPYEEKSIRLKNDSINGVADLHSPGIIRYEVGNLLWKAVKANRIADADAREALSLLGSMRIATYDLEWRDISESFSLASAVDLTVYDAAYIRLSKELRMPLITADDQLYEKGKPFTRTIHVRDF